MQQLKDETVELTDSGLVLDSQEHWPGASPDAIISVSDEKCVVEIKCPYAARNMTVKEAISNVKSFCLSRTDNKIILKSTYRYYYQMQVQLYVCKATKSDFVVWTPKDLYFMIVCINNDFLQTIIPTPKTFYFQELLLALASECML